jgi:hypothetical protein
MTKYYKSPSEVIPGKWVLHIDEQIGRFKEGDFVSWSCHYQGPIHRGVIILAVPARSYAQIEVNKRKLSLKIPPFKGYWRYHESYIVRDAKGKYWWPRVGNLKLESEYDNPT